MVNSAIVGEPRDDTYPVTVAVMGQRGEQVWVLDSHVFHVLVPE